MPELCRAILDRWPLEACVVTLGERGSYAESRAGERVHVPGHAVTVADTCGSGDAFSAAFVHLYLRGRSLADCCRLGNALGARVATQAGATAPVAPGALASLLEGGAPPEGAASRVAEPSLRDFIAKENGALRWGD